MKYIYFIILVCFNLVGCVSATMEPIIKKEIVYVKPPAEMMLPCEYVDFGIDRNEYLDMNSSDREQYLFGIVKESIMKTAVCNKMIESLNEWTKGIKK